MAEADAFMSSHLQTSLLEREAVRGIIEQKIAAKLSRISSGILSIKDFNPWLDQGFGSIIPMLPDKVFDSAFGAQQLLALIEFYREENKSSHPGGQRWEMLVLLLEACHEVQKENFGNAQPEPPWVDLVNAKHYGYEPPHKRVLSPRQVEKAMAEGLAATERT